MKENEISIAGEPQNDNATVGDRVEPVVMRLSDDWHEDYGDCLWFHFDDFESPPVVIFSNPLSSDFEENDEGYWTHFSRIDTNSVFDQAQRLSFSDTEFDIGN